MRKRLVIGFVLVFCLAFSATVGAKTKISYWAGWLNSQMFEGEKQIIEDFMEENPDIEVEFSQPADFITRFTVSIVTDTMPDIAMVSYDDFPSWYESGAYWDLKSFFAADADVDEDEFVPWAIEFFTRDEGLWAMPLTAFARDLAVYYPNVFEEAGLFLPDYSEWDWDTFEEYAGKLTIYDNGEFKQEGARFWWHFMGLQSWFWSNDVQVFNEDFTDVTINNAKGIETVKFLQNLVEKGVVSSPGHYSTLDKCGMYIGGGAYDFPYWERQEKEFDNPVRLMWHPWNDEPKKVAMLGGSAVAICANSEHPEEAWRLVKYLARPDVQLKRAQTGYGGLSVVKEYQEAVISSHISIIKPTDIYWELLFSGQPMPTFPEYRRWSNVWNPLMDKLIKGEISPEEFCLTLTTRSRIMLGQ
ncbi:MAG: extracellular solute-binding protein [Limnochordia bacterium]|jgi:multiple sugar transport system substrate-binding protein|nr:extracellular solute-binding protein [Limnochordia bacterium]